MKPKTNLNNGQAGQLPEVITRPEDNKNIYAPRPFIETDGAPILNPQEANMTNIDFEEIYNNAMRKREEEHLNAVKALHNLTAASYKQHARQQEMFNRLAELADDEARRQMEDEQIAEQTKASAAAREEVRAKYAKQHAAEWNDSESDRAFRRMARNLFGE